MRPFAAADLMRTSPSAAELAPLEPFGIQTWSQALLQWGLSHPATTVSIPATSKPSRAKENAAAGDAEATRRRAPPIGQPTRRRLMVGVRRHAEGVPAYACRLTRRLWEG